SERRVFQVADWTGGEGDKPATGGYIGATGIVTDIADAVDVRGPEGPQGPQGPPGADGADGATWHLTSGAPGSGTGKDGDFAFDPENGNVYQKSTGSWTLLGSLQGPEGPQRLLGYAELLDTLVAVSAPFTWEPVGVEVTFTVPASRAI